MSEKIDITLAVDIGGTFTDAVLDGPFGRLTHKTLTTPLQPELGLLKACGVLLRRAGYAFKDVTSFIHGTTLATNALIERKGARTALVTTEGFRDVLETGTEGRFDQYDLDLAKPAPLVSRDFRLCVRERVDAAGQVRRPLEKADVERICVLLRRENIESVAIAFLHSYANSQHESAAAEIISTLVPEAVLSLSCEVCPEIREYERISTTIANAYVKPLMAGYLGRMEEALANAGFTGRLFLVTSGGGLTSVETARQLPVRLVESGPAGGAIYASRRARELGIGKVLSFDMGGTTAKICIIKDGRPTTASSFEVDRAQRFKKGSGMPLRIPSIELIEIGAGGGSLATVDRLNRVTVGPESAGSAPGPACYPNGGPGATVTDADLTLGLLDAQEFAGGSITLSAERAAAALKRSVGAHTGLSPQVAAHAVYETVCENMASAVRVHAAERGESVGDYSMIAFGGAAPLHAARVAEKAGVGRIIIPTHAGVGSAVGFLEAAVSFELVQSMHMRLSAFDEDKVGALLSSMSDRARRVVSLRTGDAVQERRTAFMRYVGQGHEISVALPEEETVIGAPRLRELFERNYAELFARHIPDAPIEVLSWSVLVTANERTAPGRAEHVVDRAEEAVTLRRIYDDRDDSWREVPVYRRAGLSPGFLVHGPAVVLEAETSTYVPLRFTASLDRAGYIVMERKA